MSWIEPDWQEVQLCRQAMNCGHLEIYDILQKWPLSHWPVCHSLFVANRCPNELILQLFLHWGQRALDILDRNCYGVWRLNMQIREGQKRHAEIDDAFHNDPCTATAIDYHLLACVEELVGNYVGCNPYRKHSGDIAGSYANIANHTKCSLTLICERGPCRWEQHLL